MEQNYVLMELDPRFKAVCFDMDGTLLDTKVDYAKMADLIFDEMVGAGVPEDVIDRSEGYKFNLESGVDYLVSNGRGDEVFRIGERIRKVAKDVEMERVQEAKPFPKVKELLKKLRMMGLKTGILTRGCREYAEEATRISKVDSLIDGLVARDDYPENEAKPSPIAMAHIAEILDVRPKEILFLGDHLFDYQCARDSGAGFIAVLTGTYGYEDWKKVGGIRVLNSVGDLYDMIRR